MLLTRCRKKGPSVKSGAADGCASLNLFIGLPYSNFREKSG